MASVDTTGVEPDRGLILSERIADARSALESNIERLEDSCSRLQVTREQIRAGRSRRERLYRSAYARLEARLETLPLIEQAKGILMAQTGCGPEQAFDMLRRASQRSNVKVRDLATDIVDRAMAAAPNGGGKGGARDYRALVLTASPSGEPPPCPSGVVLSRD
jgi:ANTAR domain-containing protein